MSSVDTIEVPTDPADAPNPLEIFFEKNKKWIYGLAVLLVLAFAGNYGWKKFQQAKIDKEWREFTNATGLSRGTSESVTLSALPKQYEQYQQQIWSSQIYGKQQELVTKLAEDVRDADIAKIDALIAADAGHSRVPWLHWVAANKLYEDGEWAEARKRCETLKSSFGKHFLCVETPFPVQVRDEVDDPDKNKLKTEEDLEAEKKAKPEYKDPVAGSPVGKLLKAIDRDEAFRAAHPRFFKAPEPDMSETVIMKIKGVDLAKPVEVEIAFFPDVSKHVAEFKKNFSSKYYDGMRIHKIKRARKDQPDPNAPVTIHLGHPDSRKEDRTLWQKEPEGKEEDRLEFETSKVATSHFPLMVVAEQEKDGKSSARRFFICSSDCAAQYDGEYVIFGKVVRGAEHVRTIAEGSLADETQENAGEGRPGDDIQIESTELRKK